MNIFYQDAVGIVCEYLSFIEMDSMGKIFPDSSRINLKVNQMKMSSVTTQLQFHFGDYYPIFREHMMKSGAIIAGSFPGKCLRGERLGDSDIDIFIPSGSNLTFSHNPITKLEEFLFEAFTWKTYEACNRYGSDIGGHTEDNPIDWIRNFHLGPKHTSGHEHAHEPVQECHGCPQVQVIQVKMNKDTLQNYILKSFDFDICKNLYWIDPDGVDHLYIDNLHGVIQKTFKFDFGMRLGASIGRYYKYKDRGYTIDLGDKDELFHQLTSQSTRSFTLERRDILWEAERPCRLDICPAALCGKDHKHYHGTHDRYKTIIVLT